MNDFFDIKASDLDIPEILTFEPGDVEFAITDFTQDDEKGYLKLTCKVLSGEHKDNSHLYFLRKNSKQSLKNFMLAFWNREEILSGKAKPTKLIGRNFIATATEQREYKGKWYQDLENYRDLGAQNTESVKIEDVIAAF